MVNNSMNWSVIKLADFQYTNLFQALPIIALAYTCQMTVFPIWNELYKPSVRRMNIVGVASMILAGVLYISMGIFGYLLYPVNTEGNIIKDLPDTLGYAISRSVFVLAILFHYPVVHFALRNSLELVLFDKYDFSWFRHTIETVVVISGTLTWAILLPKLNKVFDLTGAFAAFPINFIIPALCYVKVQFYPKSTSVNIGNTWNTLDGSTTDGRSGRCSQTGRSIGYQPLLSGEFSPQRVQAGSLLRVGFILPILVLLVSVVSMGISIYASVLEFF